jgi:hypothetical protein
MFESWLHIGATGSHLSAKGMLGGVISPQIIVYFIFVGQP